MVVLAKSLEIFCVLIYQNKSTMPTRGRNRTATSRAAAAAREAVVVRAAADRRAARSVAEQQAVDDAREARMEAADLAKFRLAMETFVAQEGGIVTPVGKPLGENMREEIPRVYHKLMDRRMY